MYYTERGDESKKFNTRDERIRVIKRAGIKVGITSEETLMVENRSKN